MPTLTVSREQLVGEWSLPRPYRKNAPVEVLEDTITDQDRWTTSHSLIFRVKESGKIYSTWYQHGSTECQDESPWEYEDEVALVEMEPYEKTIIAYRKVAD